MKVFPALVLVFLLAPFVTSASVLTRNLQVGSYGIDVLELQRFLNTDSATQLAFSGPGSPGNETNFFGMATQKAVVKFQEKYRTEILVPNGLSFGTGIVGPSTRAVLEEILFAQKLTAQSLATASSQTVSPKNPTTAPTVPAPATVQTQTKPATSENPNVKNINTTFSYLDSVGSKQGYSASELASIKEAILKELATTTDLKAAFIDMVNNGPGGIGRAPTLTGAFFATIRNSFHKLFGAERVSAATGAPFGGAVVSVFPCLCSGTWHITITPLPPTFVVLLTYTPFSQAFLSYNIPFTTWLLGQYTPGAGICKVYVGTGCAVPPSEGMITPVVGSSPA